MTIVIVVFLSVMDLLFMALGALPLNDVTNVTVGVDDVASISDGLINFLVGVALIVPDWLAMLASCSLWARIDGVATS